MKNKLYQYQETWTSRKYF